MQDSFAARSLAAAGRRLRSPPACRRCAQKVKLATSMGDIVVELDAAKAPKTVDNFLAVREGRPLRRHGLPSRHRQLHDPGRRHDGRHEGEADARADPAREPQRPDQRARHDRDGAHDGPELGDRAVLHQREGQRLPRTRPTRATATATRCSARSSRAWTWSTRSGPCPPATRAAPERAGRAGDHQAKQPWRNEMTKTVELETSAGHDPHRARRREGARVGRRTSSTYVEQGPLRRHGVPPRHQGLHGPGRRLRARHEAEADRRADPATKPTTA